MPLILYNMACYLDCLPLEAGLGPGSGTWTGLLTQLDLLFRRLVLQLSSLQDITPLLRIMISVLRVPGIAACKVSSHTILDFYKLNLLTFYSHKVVVAFKITFKKIPKNNCA